MDASAIMLNPLRFRIIILLKKNQAMSASELARELGLPKNPHDLRLVSFHLQKLLSSGILKGVYKEKVVQNRPFMVRYYSMTEKGEKMFREFQALVNQASPLVSPSQRPS